MSAVTTERFVRVAARFAAVLIAMLVLAQPAWPQAAPPAPAQQPAPPPPPPPPPKENPGLVNEIGKLLKYPSSMLPDISMPHWSLGRGKSEQPRPAEPDGAAAPQPPAPVPPAAVAEPAPAPPPPPPPPPPAAAAPPTPAPASPSLLGGIPSMVTGRVVCPESTGGGPDCKAAADALCKTKGHSQGKSLGTDAVEKCSAKVLIPGRPRQPGDCRTESFVTSAWCQ